VDGVSNKQNETFLEMLYESGVKVTEQKPKIYDSLIYYAKQAGNKKTIKKLEKLNREKRE
jgi:hypothetical protein